MNEIRINAEPTKEFFVSMMTKDIYLKEAIIELVDNSIDGLRRMHEKEEKLEYGYYKIEIEINKKQFKIKDNCGGIPLEVAKNYAFRFGRPQSIKRENIETTGVFGIGMKRALFKIGDKFTINSITTTDRFELPLDISEWIADDNWDFPITNFKESEINNISETGTIIIVDKLHEEISNEFGSEEFISELIEHIQRRIGLEIDKGLKVYVNRYLLKGSNIEFVNDDNIHPIKQVFSYDDVKVEIYGGIGVKEKDERYSPAKAGWYIYCNGRLIVTADKTSLTTWKDIENNNSGITFTNSYAAFRGIVFFNSNMPENLPWNTTKTGIDQTSAVYIKSKQKMIDVFEMVIGLIKKINNDEVSIVKISSNAKPDNIVLTDRNRAGVNFEKSYNYEVIKPNPNPLVTITYKRPKLDVEELENKLGVSSYKEVGEKTYEYYLEAEC